MKHIFAFGSELYPPIYKLSTPFSTVSYFANGLRANYIVQDLLSVWPETRLHNEYLLI